MRTQTADRRRIESPGAMPAELAAAGGLVVTGWLTTVVATMFHPSGAEDDHRSIFAEYAASAPWIAVHLVQFVGVLVALSGVLVLSRTLHAGGRPMLLAQLASAAAVATAAVWAVLQGLDGVGLKYASDAWVAARGSEEQVRFASAETVRWVEWGLQSYFRLLLGLTFALVGAAVLARRTVAPWIGGAAVVAGLLSMVIGIDVGYSGLESGLQDALSLAFLVVGLSFGAGLVAAGVRGQRSVGQR